MALEGLAAVQARIAELRIRPTEAPTSRATTDATTGTDFAGLLAAALGSTATTSTTPVGTTPLATSTATDADGVPVELAAFGNGRIPADRLTRIAGTEHRLWAPAADAFERLRAAAAADGVAIGITDSYRDHATQVDLAERKGLYRNGGLAAVPGTSTHGWGKSLDLDLDPTARSWMRANAGRFGFVEDVPREPWHWTYRPAG
ncbi:M15 family metallopeptidase [Dermatobacter hominis]|uniref:M15 family metallopeptidase n=1 Tax=Dermatobacter hominis TaxID=2884263 RepID=UPI001D125240|nr:M15 family metallopeptidase [Dermatobacter hominis]UDY37522.1 M15 family metallopeptidase [Dermatobacter hominis]